MSIAFFLVVLCMLLLFPQQASGAAAEALRIWSLSVVPSLFPYMVLCRMLASRLRERNIPAVPVAALLGLMGGSPSGASVLAAYGSCISKKTLLALCALTGTISPMFTLGTVLSWTQNLAMCRLLLFCQLLAAFFAGGLVFLVCSDKAPACCALQTTTVCSPIVQSIDAILQVGGCIIFYSVLAGLLQLFPYFSENICAFVHGLLEVSGGIHALCSASMPDFERTLLISALCSFSGLSILSQNYAFLSPLGVRFSQLVAFALLRAVLSVCFTAVLYARFIV